MSFKENCCIFRIDIEWDLQKLGIILWKKVSPNLSQQKMSIMNFFIYLRNKNESISKLRKNF